MNEVLLSVKDLSIDFQMEDEQVQAVQHLSFELKHGETLALVGESGSGKSVSALCIMGLLQMPPAFIREGSIQFYLSEKKSLELISADSNLVSTIRGSQIGMIFQEPMTSLNPLMKCGQQVMEAIELHKKISKSAALKETIHLFEEVKLPNPATIIDRYPHELSGGQKQRVMIAMAICCDPLLLIADEPTTALDVTVQKTILDLLKDIQRKRKMAILFITHDLSLVKKFADKVLIMFKSKCVEYGSTNEIFANPKETYTKGLLACRPNNAIRIKYLPTVQDLLENSAVDRKQQNIITNQEFLERIDSLSNEQSILELRNLKVWYPTQFSFFGKTKAWFKAVNGVNLSIHKGETLGLVGESGCGKTTIGKAIVKLTDITEGEILYKGKHIDDFSNSELFDYRKEVQIIFQDPYSSLNPRIPIGRAIAETMEVHDLYSAGERKDKVSELLTKVGLLAEQAARYPHEFSGGQRQRICIARALALQPSFIICDESVSALDVSVQAQILNLLISLRTEFALSYLFISHDLGVVKHISDRIAVMQNGQIEEIGNSETIYHKPLNEYTRTLIESSY